MAKVGDNIVTAFSADIDHHFPLEVDHPISALN